MWLEREADLTQTQHAQPQERKHHHLSHQKRMQHMKRRIKFPSHKSKGRFKLSVGEAFEVAIPIATTATSGVVQLHKELRKITDFQMGMRLKSLSYLLMKTRVDLNYTSPASIRIKIRPLQ